MDSQPTPGSQSAPRPWAMLAPTQSEASTGHVAATGDTFHYPATLYGGTQNFNVYYNPNLGVAGQTIVQRCLGACERDYSVISGYFGNIALPGLPCNVIIASEVGGAYHTDCTSMDIYCQARTTPDIDVEFTSFALVAELVEVFSAVQARGWGCLASDGEGLSRVLATDLYPAQLGNYNTAGSWLDALGRPDFVTTNAPTDRNAIANGCAVLFLNYLRYQLNFSWSAIVQAAGQTPGQTYATLTGSEPADGWQRFRVLLQGHYPEGQPVNLKTDNPFPLPG